MKIKKIKQNNGLLTDEIVISNVEPTGENRKKVWLFTKRNYINEGHIVKTVVNNVTLSHTSDGKITFNGTPSGNGCFYIPIWLTKGTYIFSYYGEHILPHFTLRGGTGGYISTFIGSTDNNRIATINSDGQYIIGLDFSTGTTYTPENTSFNIQLERGTEESEYKPFEIDTVYIKNENDEYELYLKEYIIHNYLASSSKSTYSCNYINDNFNIVQANELIEIKDGFTIIGRNIFRQGNHFFGNLVVKKNSGNFKNIQEVVANLTRSCKGTFNQGCFLSNNQYATYDVGYAYFGNTVLYVADHKESGYNIAKIHVDIVCN